MLLFKKINLRLHDFVALNRTLFIIAWFYGAILHYYNPQSWRMLFDITYLLIALYILYTKISHFFARRSFINFLLNSPLNLVIGALGTGKTALMVLSSYLLSGWKTISTFPITNKQMLSLGHMSLLDYNYPILDEKSLLLWDETNLFLEGTDYKENDRVTQGLQEYFASARQFTHIVLASGQRAEHIWVKVRDIANSIIVGIRKKPVSIFRPYLQVIYGTFKSVSEYEQWRLTLINAKNDKKGRKIKYRSIPELDIYFFKLKIPMSILNLYDNKYLSFLRELSNRALNDNYQHKFWNDNVMDIEALEYLKMEKFSKILTKLKNNLNKKNK